MVAPHRRRLWFRLGLGEMLVQGVVGLEGLVSVLPTMDENKIRLLSEQIRYPSAYYNGGHILHAAPA